MVSDSPMPTFLGRKVIGAKIKQENKEIKNRKRYPKYQGQLSVM